MKLRNAVLYGLLGAILLAAGGVAWWRNSFVSDYGSYVPAKCMGQITDGESCIQKEITDAEKLALMKGNSFNEDGYFKITGTEKDLAIIDDILSISKAESRKLDAGVLNSIRGQAVKCGEPEVLLGVLPEFAGRWSAVYGTRDKRRLLLTRYDFYATGGRVARFEYMLRAVVNDSPANVTLIQRGLRRQKLWLVSWESKGVSFELYVEALNGAERDSFADALHSASVIDGKCHWVRDKFVQPAFPPPTEKERSRIKN